MPRGIGSVSQFVDLEATVGVSDEEDEDEDAHGTPYDNYMYSLFTYRSIFSDHFFDKELTEDLARFTGVDKSQDRGWNDFIATSEDLYALGGSGMTPPAPQATDRNVHYTSGMTPPSPSIKRNLPTDVDYPVCHFAVRCHPFCSLILLLKLTCA